MLTDISKQNIVTILLSTTDIHEILENFVLTVEDVDENNVAYTVKISLDTSSINNNNNCGCDHV